MLSALRTWPRSSTCWSRKQGKEGLSKRGFRLNIWPGWSNNLCTRTVWTVNTRTLKPDGLMRQASWQLGNATCYPQDRRRSCRWTAEVPSVAIFLVTSKLIVCPASQSTLNRNHVVFWGRDTSEDAGTWCWLLIELDVLPWHAGHTLLSSFVGSHRQFNNSTPSLSQSLSPNHHWLYPATAGGTPCMYN